MGPPLVCLVPGYRNCVYVEDPNGTSLGAISSVEMLDDLMTRLNKKGIRWTADNDSPDLTGLELIKVICLRNCFIDMLMLSDYEGIERHQPVR